MTNMMKLLTQGETCFGLTSVKAAPEVSSLSMSMGSSMRTVE